LSTSLFPPPIWEPRPLSSSTPSRISNFASDGRNPFGDFFQESGFPFSSVFGSSSTLNGNPSSFMRTCPVKRKFAVTRFQKKVSSLVDCVKLLDPSSPRMLDFFFWQSRPLLRTNPPPFRALSSLFNSFPFKCRSENFFLGRVAPTRVSQRPIKTIPSKICILS